MKLIVGLGNPGVKYKMTRHNIGFIILDMLQEKYNFGEFKSVVKFKGDVSTGIIGGEKIILLKPQTYMNLSGESVSKIVNFYKIDISDIHVIYDDISMDFGKVRHRNKGSHGGQNGMKDIIKYCGQDVSRLKIGVGHNKYYNLSDWVLSNFTEEERISIDNEIFSQVEQLLIEKFLKKD